jgi:spore coat protein U-like protein
MLGSSTMQLLLARRALRGLACAAALCAILLSSDERANAANATDSLFVGADINATCTISISIDLDFGTLDLSSPTPQSGFGSIGVSCTNGSPVYITLGQGLYPAAGSTDTAPIRQMSAGGSDRIDYNIYRDAAFTIPWGNTPASGAVLTGTGGADSAALYARVPAGQQVLSGTYTD